MSGRPEGVLPNGDTVVLWLEPHATYLNARAVGRTLGPGQQGATLSKRQQAGNAVPAAPR